MRLACFSPALQNVEGCSPTNDLAVDQRLLRVTRDSKRVSLHSLNGSRLASSILLRCATRGQVGVNPGKFIRQEPTPILNRHSMKSNSFNTNDIIH